MLLDVYVWAVCVAAISQQPEAAGSTPSSSGRYPRQVQAVQTLWLSRSRRLDALAVVKRDEEGLVNATATSWRCVESARTDASSVDARDIAKASARRVKIAARQHRARVQITGVYHLPPTLSRSAAGLDLGHGQRHEGVLLSSQGLGQSA